jgi:hypothetical protein
MGEIPGGYDISSIGRSDSIESALGRCCFAFRAIGLHNSSPIVFASLVRDIFIKFQEVLQQRSMELANIKLNRTIGRKIMRTLKGYIGLASHATQEGDIIALVKGGRVPLVLRRRLNGNWGLVGDIYVYGIMIGEAFEENKCKEIRIE